MAQTQTSIFPAQFEFDNDIWYLHYDSANPVTVRPDLTNAQIMNASCDLVAAPNGGARYWQVSILWVIPSQTLPSGNMTAERRILGIRLFEENNKPANINALNPNDILYYIAKPRFDANTNKAQTLFDILIGRAYSDQQKQQAVDRDWGRRILSDMLPQPQTQRRKHVQPEPSEQEPDDE